MDQASASPAASCAHNPAAPRTSSSCSQSADQSQTVGPPPARSSPRSEPHSEPVHIVPRPSSPALCQSDAKGYLLPDFYFGCATGIPGRLTEGLLLWRSQSCFRIPQELVGGNAPIPHWPLKMSSSRIRLLAREVQISQRGAHYYRSAIRRLLYGTARAASGREDQEPLRSDDIAGHLSMSRRSGG